MIKLSKLTLKSLTNTKNPKYIMCIFERYKIIHNPNMQHNIYCTTNIMVNSPTNYQTEVRFTKRFDHYFLYKNNTKTHDLIILALGSPRYDTIRFKRLSRILFSIVL